MAFVLIIQVITRSFFVPQESSYPAETKKIPKTSKRAPESAIPTLSARKDCDVSNANMVNRFQDATEQAGALIGTIATSHRRTIRLLVSGTTHLKSGAIQCYKAAPQQQTYQIAVDGFCTM